MHDLCNILPHTGNKMAQPMHCSKLLLHSCTRKAHASASAFVVRTTYRNNEQLWEHLRPGTSEHCGVFWTKWAVTPGCRYFFSCLPIEQTWNINRNFLISDILTCIVRLRFRFFLVTSLPCAETDP